LSSDDKGPRQAAAVFGALPGNPAAATAFAQQANDAEGDVKTADAAYVAAQKA
jgi:hypothetical protein